MFNLSGSELIFLVLIALVVLGPDKLPEAMRKAGKAYADFKKMTTGFQSEMKSVLDEPMRELRETAELAKRSAMWDVKASAAGGRETNAETENKTSDEGKEPELKPVSASMADHEPDDAVARRNDRAKPPDLNVSTAALPVIPKPAAPIETRVETPADSAADPDGVPSA